MGALLLMAALGLGWYFRSALLSVPGSTPAPAQVSDQPKKAPTGTKPDAKGSKASRSESGSDAGEKEPERFEFYDMLPEAEVDVNVQSTVRPAVPPPVSVPGIYVIQAGAYPNFAEADKVKARLALLGIVADIQKAEANGALFHRVRIGPINDLRELNRIRGRLRDSHIDYLVIPVRE
ncbi:MAG: SPOR domain-containing protein [Gammaproteobacteria bacterium]